MNKDVFKEGEFLINNKKLKFKITFFDVSETKVNKDLIDDFCDEMESQLPSLIFSDKHDVANFSDIKCLIVDNNENETRRLVKMISDITIHYSLITESQLTISLEQGQYDIVFLSLNLDWRNSNFKSIFNCREYIVRKYGVNICIVLTSEYTLSAHEKLHYITEGFDDVIEKPVIIKKMLRLFSKVKSKPKN